MTFLAIFGVLAYCGVAFASSEPPKLAQMMILTTACPSHPRISSPTTDIKILNRPIDFSRGICLSG